MGQGALHISKTSNRKVTSTNAAQQSNLHFDALETSHGRQRIGGNWNNAIWEIRTKIFPPTHPKAESW